MTEEDIRKIRARAWQYRSQEVANCAGLDLSELTEFIGGTLRPSDEQLQKLSRRMGLIEAFTS